MAFESIETKIPERIRKCGRGNLLFASDFVRYGEQKSVSKALERMMKDGTILRISQGVYCYPKIDKVLGMGILYPTLEEIAEGIAKRLVLKYGAGWKDRKLLHCIRAAYTFTEDEIVYATRIQLTWTHLRTIMFIEDPMARQFYVEMTRIEHWDTRTLADKIDKQLYERTAISRKPKLMDIYIQRK